MPKSADNLAIDFAALRMLRLVYNLQSFSKAAEVLDVNQSTVSYTIERLRTTFRDPLFVRQGGGVVPTRRCLEIVRKAGELIDAFEALVAPSEFVPSQASDIVTISCNYYERRIILPSFIRELRRLAPNVSVEVKTAAGQGVDLLKRSEADLLIGPAQVLEGHLYHRALMEDYYVCVMDDRHPLAGAVLTMDDYLEANHAIVTYGGNWRSPYLLELERHSLALKRILSIPSLSDRPEHPRRQRLDLHRAEPVLRHFWFLDPCRDLPGSGAVQDRLDLDASDPSLGVPRLGASGDRHDMRPAAALARDPCLMLPLYFARPFVLRPS